MSFGDEAGGANASTSLRQSLHELRQARAMIQRALGEALIAEFPQGNVSITNLAEVADVE